MDEYNWSTRRQAWIFYVALAAVLFAISGTSSKFLFHSGITPYQLIQLRTTLAFTSLLILLCLRHSALLKCSANEFHKLTEQSKGPFSMRKQTITSFEMKDDQAFICIEYEGVLASDLPNGMKVGEILRLNGRSEFAFRDGKIHRITDIS